MNWYLETERLQLRALCESDARFLYDLNSDPAVMKYLGTEPLSIEGLEEVVTRVMTRDRGYQNQLGLFVTFEKNSGEFMGWLILRPGKEAPDDTKNLEIGWRLKQRFWGKGYGTEAALALKERAKSKLGVQRLYAMAMAENVASIRIMEKIGLTLERTFIDQDEYWKTPTKLVVYSLKLAFGGS